MTGVEDDDPLLSIGVFARRARLSPKALRLYDRQGLLAPDRVDAVTGYRYYRESRLATARLIVRLRGLDMPLARIAEVLTAPGPDAARLVAGYWEGVERRIAAQRELAVQAAPRPAGGPDGVDPSDLPIDPARATEVTGAVRTEPAHREAYTTLTKAQVEYPQILSAYDAVYRWIEENGSHETGPGREVYFADWASAGSAAEVCDIAVPVA